MQHPKTLLSTTAVALAAALSTTAPSLALPATARANAPDTGALVWAARTCYLEASFRHADCVALLWVARKKAERVQRPWVDVLRDYSSIRVTTPRSKEISGYPWGDVPGKGEKFNRRWEELRELVVAFAAGAHPDPCPSAEHWGGSMDAPQGRMIKARCAVSTANTFYAIGSRSRVRFARHDVGVQ